MAKNLFILFLLSPCQRRCLRRKAPKMRKRRRLASLAVLEQYDENPYAVRLRLRFVLKRRLHQDSIEAQTEPRRRLRRLRNRSAGREQSLGTVRIILR